MGGERIKTGNAVPLLLFTVSFPPEKARRFQRFFDGTREIRLFYIMNNDTMSWKFHDKGLNPNASTEAIPGGADALPLCRNLGNRPCATKAGHAVPWALFLWRRPVFDGSRHLFPAEPDSEARRPRGSKPVSAKGSRDRRRALRNRHVFGRLFSAVGACRYHCGENRVYHRDVLPPQNRTDDLGEHRAGRGGIILFVYV